MFDICATCGRGEGFHRLGCPNAPSFSLGMGTVPIGRDDDDLSDCAAEGFASLDHVAPPQEHAA
jgi:hypothetical protein